LIAQWLSERFGQPFVIENRPGAGSNIATEAVVNSQPDGYTLLMVSTSAAVSATFYHNLNFNLIRDIAPVAGVVRVPLVMVVNPSVPTQTVPEFIAYAKANPGKINMASVGNGTTPHMAGEVVQDDGRCRHASRSISRCGARADRFAWRASAGHVRGLLSLTERSRTGRLRALAVTPVTRSPLLPDVPTVDEFLPGYEASVWFGVGAPKTTPAEIVDKLNEEINAGLADPKLEARLGELGGTVLALSPAEFGKLFAEDTDKWGKVVRAANIKLESSR
jgi:tripartite-type tricarboxylate transporter receptor subunit TctC